MSGCHAALECTAIAIGEQPRIAFDAGVITDDPTHVTVCVDGRCAEDVARPGTRFVVPSFATPGPVGRKTLSVSVVVHRAVAPISARADLPLTTHTFKDSGGCKRSATSLQAVLHSDGTLTIR